MSTLTDLLSGAGSAVGTGLDYLSAPGRYTRGALAGMPGQKMAGREMLEALGLLRPNTPGLDWGDVAGFGADVLVDPLNLIPLGAIGKLAGLSRKARLAEKLAMPAGLTAEAGLRGMPEIATAMGRETPLSVALTGDASMIMNPAESALAPLKPWHIGDPPSWVPQPVRDTLQEAVFPGSGKHFTEELPIPGGPRFVRDPLEAGGAAYDVMHGDKPIGLVEVRPDWNLDQGSKRLFPQVVKPEEQVLRLQNIGLAEGATGDPFRQTGVGREMWRKAFGETGDNWLGNSQLGFQGGDTTAVDSLQKLADRGFVELHWGRYGPGSNFVAKLTDKGKRWVAGEIDVPWRGVGAAVDRSLGPRAVRSSVIAGPGADVLSQLEIADQYKNFGDIKKWLGPEIAKTWIEHPDRLKGVIAPSFADDIRVQASMFARHYGIDLNTARDVLEKHQLAGFEEGGLEHARMMKGLFQETGVPGQPNIVNPNSGIPRFKDGPRALDDIRLLEETPSKYYDLGGEAGGTYSPGIAPNWESPGVYRHVPDPITGISRPERVRPRRMQIAAELYSPEERKLFGVHETDHYLHDADNVSPELQAYLETERKAANLERMGMPTDMQYGLGDAPGIGPIYPYVTKEPEVLARLEEIRKGIIEQGGTRYGGAPLAMSTGEAGIPPIISHKLKESSARGALLWLRKVYPDSVIQRMLQNVPVVAGASVIPAAAAAYGGNLSQQY